MSIRAALTPPPPGSTPRQTFEWLRRMEIALGIAAIVAGLTIWDIGWWHWLLVAIGVLGVLPWGGIATILRKADRDPSVLIADPAWRQANAKRRLAIWAPLQTAAFFGVGYLLDGWGAAIFMGAISGISFVIATRWLLRREQAALLQEQPREPRS